MRLLSSGQVVASGDDDVKCSWRGGGADRKSNGRGLSTPGILEVPAISLGAETLDPIC